MIEKLLTFDQLFEEYAGLNGFFDGCVTLEEHGSLDEVVKDSDDDVVEIDFRELGKPTGWMTWGIFNPFGPTVMTIGAWSRAGFNSQLIIYRALNPFSQKSILVGAIDEDFETTPANFLHELFKIQSQASSLAGALPSFIRVSEESTTLYLDEIWLEACLHMDINLEAECKLLAEHQGDPWGLASKELETAAKNRKNMSKGTNAQTQRFRVTDELVSEYLELIFNRDHLLSVIGAFPHAWKGAIDHNYLPAMDYESLLEALQLSGVKINSGYIA